MTASDDDTGKSASISSFLSSLLINSVVAAVLLLAYVCMRRRYPAFYFPRSLSGGPAPRVPLGCMAWLRTVVSLSDDALLRHAGFDALLFNAFLTMSVKLFLALSVLGCFVLVPLNAAAGTNGQGGLDSLSLSNVAPSQTRLLWVHCASGYVFSAITLWLLRGMSRRYVALRHAHLARNRVQNYTVLATNLPAECSTDASLWEAASNLFPDQVAAVALARDTRAVQAAASKRDASVQQLERAVVALDRARSAAEEAGSAAVNDSDLRPTLKVHRKCGCVGGKVVDAIDHHSTALQEHTDALNTLRATPPQPVRAGFITFNNLLSKQIAAQAQVFAHRDTDVVAAPEPRDVLWRNLGLSADSKAVRTALVQVVVFFMVVFWSIPVAFSASLANLHAIAQNKGFHWLRPVVESSPAVIGVLQGYLPTIVLAVFISLVPVLLAALSRAQGLVSRSAIEFGVARKFFLFIVFNVFLVTALAGSVFAALHQIVDKPTSIVRLLATSLPTTSNFFIAYLLLQALSAMPMALLRPVPLLVCRLKLWLFAKTDRDQAAIEEAAIGSLNYGAVLPQCLLVFVIALTYSTISPIICVVACLFFSLACLVFRTNMLYVYNQPFETGGMFWAILFRRVLVGLLMYQFTMIGLLSLHKAPAQSSALLPLPVVTAVAWWWIRTRQYIRGDHLPVQLVQELPSGVEPEARSPTSSLSAITPLLSPGARAPVSPQYSGSGSGDPGAETVATGSVSIQDDVPVSVTYSPPWMQPGLDTQPWDANPLSPPASPELMPTRAGGAGAGAGASAGAGAGVVARANAGSAAPTQRGGSPKYTAPTVPPDARLQ